MEPKVKVSDYHEHKDGTSGYDIYVDKGNDRVGKMHVVDYGASDNEESKGLVESFTGAIASFFGKNK